jgi:hypothetical protein
VILMIFTLKGVLASLCMLYNYIAGFDFEIVKMGIRLSILTQGSAIKRP